MEAPGLGGLEEPAGDAVAAPDDNRSIADADEAVLAVAADGASKLQP